MHLTLKDWIASALVGAGALAWALWSLGLGPQGAAGARGVTGMILGLGFAASASAVVPGSRLFGIGSTCAALRSSTGTTRPWRCSNRGHSNSAMPVRKE